MYEKVTLTLVAMLTSPASRTVAEAGASYLITCHSSTAFTLLAASVAIVTR